MSQPPYGPGPGYPPPGGPGYPQQGGPGQPGNYPPPPPGYNPGPGYPQQGPPMLDRAMVTTANEFSGFRIVRYLGIVRGLTVRSRSVIGNIGAGFQTLVGGKITIYVELCENTREEAFSLMLQHAAQMGATGIVAMRYDATEVADGVTEVLCYGTAVVIQPTEQR